MSHKNSPKKERRAVGHVGTCLTHGKLLYTNRQHARNAINGAGEKGMRAYHCDAVDGYWHIGHNPKPVMRGEQTAREVFRR